MIRLVFDISTAKVLRADTDRIDVSIVGKDYYIIVENKINSAVEQKGQIYRYYQVAKQQRFQDHEIYALYLNPASNDEPSYYSLNMGDKLYWCIRNIGGNSKEEEVEYFEKLIVNSGLKSQGADTSGYPIWNYTTPQNAYSRIKILLSILKTENLL